MVALGESAPGAIQVDVQVVEPLGSQNLLTVEIGGHKMKVATHPTFDAAAGQPLWVQFPAEQIRWIDPESELVLAG